ncbi:hypothetical protein RFI_02718 [Reticulomyxa filosa]|uniref:Uncharacterized protein n=1 Tax=Reticulomyxa filosa TaxID=46433 RepID=X6P8K4_RETFI|nr:hypothetical protein RFI_02718 [Reticulomyxa filosa]|eukprot:ETO34374.1 hypothetical protein RFI_02718 [Reticulomyxa filosa]
MLTDSQLEQLLSLFGEENQSKTFGEIGQLFWSTFASEFGTSSSSSTNGTGEQFRFDCASTLSIFLKDRDNSPKHYVPMTNTLLFEGFFTAIQRLIALYLIRELYNHIPIGNHPFLPLFIRIIDKSPQDLTGKFLDGREFFFPLSQNEQYHLGIALTHTKEHEMNGPLLSTNWVELQKEFDKKDKEKHKNHEKKPRSSIENTLKMLDPYQLLFEKTAVDMYDLSSNFKKQNEKIIPLCDRVEAEFVQDLFYYKNQVEKKIAQQYPQFFVEKYQKYRFRNEKQKHVSTEVNEDGKKGVFFVFFFFFANVENEDEQYEKVEPWEDVEHVRTLIRSKTDEKIAPFLYSAVSNVIRDPGTDIDIELFSKEDFVDDNEDDIDGTSHTTDETREPKKKTYAV